MTEDARSLLTLLGLIFGSVAVALLVVAGYFFYCFKGDRRE